MAENTATRDVAQMAYEMAREIWINENGSMPSFKDAAKFIKLTDYCARALQGHLGNMDLLEKLLLK